MQSPDLIFQELFKDLHQSKLWNDQKIISDAIPLLDPEIILTNYRSQKQKPNFDLKHFFDEHFKIQQDKIAEFESDTSISTEEHIKRIWPLLKREADDATLKNGSSLIPLPFPYIVPGGRFNEIYYWDSYFTMLGLQVHGRISEIEGMVKNFAYLIDTYGFIPNGNRSYFLGRSQPPFFALMVELLAESLGDQILKNFYPQLEKEYHFWMDQHLQNDSTLQKRKINLEEQVVLNRYHDAYPQARQEMYQHDLDAFSQTQRIEKEFFLDVRSACESGWDFSCRWFKNRNDFDSIQTSQILPVDLNCLLYQLELTLSKASAAINDHAKHEFYRLQAANRKSLINKYFWSDSINFYSDYNFIEKHSTDIFSLAGVYPLFFKIASQEQASNCSQIIKSQFLRDGGLVSTIYNTGQQWDAPNGWAPLQWMTIKGLMNYGFNELAEDIAQRWTDLNTSVFKRTGKMMEKYNVEDTSLLAGGGEYEGQAGFGWTNGVFVKLMQILS